MSQLETEYGRTPGGRTPGELRGIVDAATPGLVGAEPEAVLRWALTAFARDRVALFTSFQAAGMAVLDMAWRVNPEIQVITIDSGRLPEETFDLMTQVRARYGIAIEVLSPDAGEVSELVTRHGVNLFYESPELRLSCCEVRKVRPLNRRLAGLDAWITGLRRSQGIERGATAEVEVDEVHGGIVKVNPVAGWSRAQVRDYIAANNVPMNELYAKGYTSIGCAPCTRATGPGEDPRAGRWWWEQGAKECGLHYDMAVDSGGNSTVTVTSAKEALER